MATQLHIRCSDDELRHWKGEAKKDGKTLTDLIRSRLPKAPAPMCAVCQLRGERLSGCRECG